MKDIKHNKTNLLLVNYALSLQSKTQQEFTVEELSDFITGHTDVKTKNKILKAINSSPALMQQWLDINQTLGVLTEQSKVPQKKSLVQKVKEVFFLPWLVPATAMAVVAMFFIPQLIRPNTDALLNQVYNNWQVPNYEFRSIPPVFDSKPVSNAVDLYKNGFQLGQYLWNDFKNSGERIEPWNLCLESNVNNCQKVQELAIQAGQLKAMIESHCGNNPSKEFVKNTQEAYSNIKEGLKNFEFEFLLDFEEEIEGCGQ
ncbi:MAG: hypothetical protein R3E90_06215 [Marinicella sp.]